MAKATSVDTSSAEQARFKKKIVELDKFLGRGTELISVYIPPGTDRGSVVGQLNEEMSQSSNIKSPTTRKNVQGALRKIDHYLKVIDFKIPGTGLVVFAGNISEKEGKSDLRLFTVVPIKQLKVKLYWCDNKFHLDPLKEMQLPTEAYALLTLDKREATLALLEGKRYNVIGKMTSAVPGKIRAGGQSAARFARLREEAEHEFYKRISERANSSFVPLGDKLKGMIVGGPGTTKQHFLSEGLLDHRLKDRILGTIDTGYVDESGIRELVQKSDELLKDTELMKERAILNKFLEEVVKEGLATYGLSQVEEALKIGQVQTLLVSEGLEWRVVKHECIDCGLIEEKIVKEPLKYDERKEKCSKCKGRVELLEEIDLQDYLLEKAKSIGAEIIMVSTETNEGMQFLNVFGGLGAILRYRL